MKKKTTANIDVLFEQAGKLAAILESITPDQIEEIRATWTNENKEKLLHNLQNPPGEFLCVRECGKVFLMPNAMNATQT